MLNKLIDSYAGKLLCVNLNRYCINYIKDIGPDPQPVQIGIASLSQCGYTNFTQAQNLHYNFYLEV